MLTPEIRLWQERVTDPQATAELLSEAARQLSRYRVDSNNDQRIAVLKAVAAHPNCPPQTFATLLQDEAMEAACENPAWDLLVMEGILGYLGRESVLISLERGALPRRYVALLCHHTSGVVRQAAQEHVAVAGEVEGDLREALLTKLATLRRDGRLVWLARFGLLPEALNARLPHRVIVSPLGRRRGHRQPSPAVAATPEQWELARSDQLADWHAQEAMAADPKTPRELLEYLAIKHTTAMLNPSAPLELALSLWQELHNTGELDPYSGLKLAKRLLQAPQLSAELHREAFLMRCALSQGGLSSVLATANLSVPTIVEHLAQNHHKWKKRLGVALNTTDAVGKAGSVYWFKPIGVLEYLAEDSNRWVRAVARKRLAEPKWRLF